MKSSDSNSQLPAWIFIATDLALIGAAGLIAATSPKPLSGSAVLWIAGCVGLGAIAGLVPLVLIHERRKNEQLDERQRELEALARTVSSSAEQISIAAGGLHQIAELALKNLRMAEHLPQKLQEKVAEFQSQLAAADDAEKEELERELLALRTSESERLESAAQRIAKSAAEWSKLEATVQQHLAATTETAARLGATLDGAITQARTAAEQALAQARIEAARGVGNAAGEAVRALEAAKAAALVEFDAKLATAAALVAARVTATLDARLAATPAPAAPPPEHPATPSPAAAEANAVTRFFPPPSSPEPATPPPATAVTPGPPVATTDDAQGETPRPPAPAAPRRPRRPRREEPVPVTVPDVAAPPASTEEPPPVPAGEIPEVAPVAPNTAEPFHGHLAATPIVEPPVAVAAAGRHRLEAVRPDDEPALGLELGDSSSGSVAEGVLTSDGATRLLVTAYIGIGNRLFIRGDGPGMSWDKGMPLQFVSIGKWRWESNDAAAPVRFRLYKNDTQECSALGEQRVEPAHQLEVTAAF